MAGASTERPAPSATGSLATRPLVHLLVYARNNRLNGLLELHAPDGAGGSLSLWRGRIHDARTQPAVAYFGTVAYELGFIDTADARRDAARDRAFEAAPRRGARRAWRADAQAARRDPRRADHPQGSLPLRAAARGLVRVLRVGACGARAAVHARRDRPRVGRPPRASAARRHARGGQALRLGRAAPP